MFIQQQEKRNLEIQKSIQWESTAEDFLQPEVFEALHQEFEFYAHPHNCVERERIYIPLGLPGRKEIKQELNFLRDNFYFLRSTGQLSAEGREARQSWRSRKRKSQPKDSFVPTRFKFPFWVILGDVFFNSTGVCSTMQSKIITPCSNIHQKLKKKLTYL